MFKKSDIYNYFGLMIPADSLRSAKEWLALAKNNNFREVQMNLCWRPLEQSDLRELKEILTDSSLRCRAIGVYCDMLQMRVPHPYFGTSIDELRKAIEWCSEIGVESVIVWSGSYAKDWLGRDWRNQTSPARNALKRRVKLLLPLLRERNLRLLFEPWHTHVLGSESELAAFCKSHLQNVGCVLDVSNLIEPVDWSIRYDRLDAIVNTLLPFVGVVHLKDMIVDSDGQVSLPAVDCGRLDCRLVLKMIRPLLGRVPVIVEHVSMEQVATTRRFLESLMNDVDETD